MEKGEETIGELLDKLEVETEKFLKQLKERREHLGLSTWNLMLCEHAKSLRELLGRLAE